MPEEENVVENEESPDVPIVEATDEPDSEEASSEDQVASEPVADATEEEAPEATESSMSHQDAIQARFVAGAQALEERKKAERGERLSADEDPKASGPLFVHPPEKG